MTQDRYKAGAVMDGGSDAASGRHARPQILYVSSCWLAGRSYGGQLRASALARALQTIGDVSVAVVSADANDAEARTRTEEHFPVVAAIQPDVIRGNRINRQCAQLFASGFMGAHGVAARMEERAHMERIARNYDLIWVSNSRTPNILQRWDWGSAHLDIDDIPSTYFLAEAKSAAHWKGRWKARMQAAAARRREQRLRERFATLSVCSEEDRSYLGGGPEIRVIPNGFAKPTHEPRRAPNPSQPRIGFIGLYTYEPNREGVRWFLQNCWPAIRARIPGIRFRLVGSGTDGEDRPTDSGVDPLGWVDDSAAEIATWSATVIPIRKGGGTRIKIAEAYSRKCPIISTSLGAFGYGAENGRQLRLADTASAFIDACVETVLNADEAARMADRAWLEFLERWTWDAIALKVQATAENCLRRVHNQTGSAVSR